MVPMGRGRRRAVALVAAGLLAVFLVAWLGDREARRDPGVRTPEGEAGRAVPSAPAVPESRPAPPPSESASAKGPSEVAPSDTPPAEGDPATSPGDPVEASGEGKGIRIAGRVEFEGTGRRPGEFTFAWRRGGLRDPEESPPRLDRGVVGGIDGAFEETFPGPGTYTVSAITAEDLEYPEATKTVELQAGTELVLVLRERKPTVLLVRDAASKAPVPGARAWEERGDSTHGVPGGAYGPSSPRHLKGLPLVADDEGRIPVPGGKGAAYLAVRAAGTAWTRVATPRDAGEIVVELIPGGAVRLQVKRLAELEEARVFMGSIPEAGRPPDEEDGAAWSDAPPDIRWEEVSLPPEGDTLLLEGLPCGPRRFQVQRGDTWQKTQVYGSVDVEVVRGETVAAAVETTPAGAGPKFALRATLVLSAEWGPLPTDDATIFEVEGAEPRTAHVNLWPKWTAEEETREIEFTTDPVPAGRYRLLTDRFGWGTEFDLSGEATAHRWTLPAPARVVVLVLDDESGRPLARASLRARNVPDYHRGGESGESGETGECMLRITPGTWIVECQREGYEDWTIRVEVPEPSEIRRTVRLRKASGVEVQFHLDDVLFLGPVEVEVQRDTGSKGTFAQLQSEKGDDGGVLFSTSTTASSGKFQFTDLPPGAWIVKATPPPGFEPVEPKKVELERGKRVSVRFDLVRKK
jgi:hypothetical protein